MQLNSVAVYGERNSLGKVKLNFPENHRFIAGRQKLFRKIVTSAQSVTVRSQSDAELFGPAMSHLHPGAQHGCPPSYQEQKAGEGAGFADLNSFAVSQKNKILLFNVLCPKGFARSHISKSIFSCSACRSCSFNTGNVISKGWGSRLMALAPCSVFITDLATWENGSFFPNAYGNFFFSWMSV